MKTTVAVTIVAALAVVSLCLAESTDSSPKPGETPPNTLQGIQAELTKTQAQLQQVVARVTALEQQVRSLEQANAKLRQELKAIGEPHLVPLERK